MLNRSQECRSSDSKVIRGQLALLCGERAWPSPGQGCPPSSMRVGVQEQASSRWPRRILCGDEWTSDDALKHYQLLIKGLPDMSNLLRRNEGSDGETGQQLQLLSEHGVLERFRLHGRVRSLSLVMVMVDACASTLLPCSPVPGADIASESKA